MVKGVSEDEASLDLRPRKRRRGLIITLVALLLACVISVPIWFLMSSAGFEAEAIAIVEESMEHGTIGARDGVGGISIYEALDVPDDTEIQVIKWDFYQSFPPPAGYVYGEITIDGEPGRAYFQVVDHSWLMERHVTFTGGGLDEPSHASNQTD